MPDDCTHKMYLQMHAHVSILGSGDLKKVLSCGSLFAYQPPIMQPPIMGLFSRK